MQQKQFPSSQFWVLAEQEHEGEGEAVELVGGAGEVVSLPVHEHLSFSSPEKK